MGSLGRLPSVNLLQHLVAQLLFVGYESLRPHMHAILQSLLLQVVVIAVQTWVMIADVL